jgi:hypothetical protein
VGGRESDPPLRKNISSQLQRKLRQAGKTFVLSSRVKRGIWFCLRAAANVPHLQMAGFNNQKYSYSPPKSLYRLERVQRRFN